MHSPFLFALLVFFFNDTATTEIYTLSLHDALPICFPSTTKICPCFACCACARAARRRSEEHTSELQSLTNLVCRLLLEKKKNCSQGVRHRKVHDNCSFACFWGRVC